MFLLHWEVYVLMELVVNLRNEDFCICLVGRGHLLMVVYICVVCICVLVGV